MQATREYVSNEHDAGEGPHVRCRVLRMGVALANRNRDYEHALTAVADRGVRAYLLEPRNERATHSLEKTALHRVVGRESAKIDARKILGAKTV
ncbi:MAG: hypothetical protein FLDDKLPJ_03658 [Phycisphaerae bacterium]|nr:hypothetical protein [Phycisphaerae bacterium]